MPVTAIHEFRSMKHEACPYSAWVVGADAADDRDLQTQGPSDDNTTTKAMTQQRRNPGLTASPVLAFVVTFVCAVPLAAQTSIEREIRSAIAAVPHTETVAGVCDCRVGA